MGVRRRARIVSVAMAMFETDNGRKIEAYLGLE